jgi:hypothetical protein
MEILFCVTVETVVPKGWSVRTNPRVKDLTTQNSYYTEPHHTFTMRWCVSSKSVRFLNVDPLQ